MKDRNRSIVCSFGCSALLLGVPAMCQQMLCGRPLSPLSSLLLPSCCIDCPPSGSSIIVIEQQQLQQHRGASLELLSALSPGPFGSFRLRREKAVQALS